MNVGEDKQILFVILYEGDTDLWDKACKNRRVHCRPQENTAVELNYRWIHKKTSSNRRSNKCF